MMSSLSEIRTEKEELKAIPNKHKKARTVLSLLLVLLLIVAIIADLYVSNNLIEISSYTVKSDKAATSFSIAVISDLHLKEFGDNNVKLIDKVQKQQPDIILTVGDIIGREDTDRKSIDTLSHVIKSLSEIAPVYFSLGNHERNNPELDAIKETVTDCGATILEMEYMDIEVKGNPVRIGGISYYRSWDEEANAFITDFVNCSDERFTLLLCHNPEFYQWGIENYPIDLFVSGHTHGGMVRLPFVGGLYAPEQGWFPEYSGGLYEAENGHIAVTRGLASSPEYMPRVNNRPEIMIIEVS